MQKLMVAHLANKCFNFTEPAAYCRFH